MLGLVNALPSMPICSACGGQWRANATRCELCDDPSGTRRDARVDATLGWIRVTASFPCRSCGQQSPFDGFDGDGNVACAGCGLTQAFHVPVWDKLFHDAHGLADLGFPLPFGRGPETPELGPVANPYAAAGNTRVRFRVDSADLITVGGVVRTNSLRADFGLGVPLCETCHEPLETEADARSLRTRCQRCSTVRTYARPDFGDLRHAPFALLSAEARSDAQDARSVTDAGGAVAIKCPSCGAGLDVRVDTPIVTCAYCKTSCRVPSRTLHQIRPGIVPPRPFWMAFKGPSGQREALAHEGRLYLEGLEATKSIEALTAHEPPPEIVRRKLALTAVVLFVVGLAFVPAILDRVEAARVGAVTK